MTGHDAMAKGWRPRCKRAEKGSKSVMQDGLLAAFEKEFPHSPPPLCVSTCLMLHAGPTHRAERGCLWRWLRHGEFRVGR